MVHRGPDDEGYVNRDGCALGFCRLSIMDVGAPTQPFSNEDGRVWSVCNGEIYNFDDLRSRLESRGHTFRTRVDTEVLPHLYEACGPDLCERLNGMFAFAVWDEGRRTLVLGRDRAGEKPLFFFQGKRELVFASELQALLAHPGAPRVLDPVGLRRYLLHDFFPAPLTPIRGIQKIPAGHMLIVKEGHVSTRRYWDLAAHFLPPAGPPARTSEIAVELDHRIAVAVGRRKRSDVPIGVFLSGGIDSATILSHLTEQEGPGIPVFALGHSDRSFDESRFAHRLARIFRADFNELILDETDLADGLQRVGAGMGEPLGDASVIPSHLLALFAREKVKVVLSGEGGDELFAGYPTYVGNSVAERYRKLPRAIRRILAALARRASPVTMGNVGIDYLLARFLDGAEQDRLQRHHRWFGSLAPERHLQVLGPPVLEALRGDDPFASARRILNGRSLPDGLAELLYSDFTMYLQDDLLTKVDRATMLASLEARAPFLDHELAEFAAGLPSHLKLQGLTTKAILRRASRRRLPREVLRRRKRGFNIPFSRWLLHGLGDRLRQRFSAERVLSRGLLSPTGVAALIEEHLSRKADHRKPLFTLLALDLWCDRIYGEGAAVPLAENRTITTTFEGTGP